jgi:glycosyltransferase involved in cell wall biosynthesis
VTSEAPSLSVVVPVHNEPEAIGAALRKTAGALRASRWTNPEIVVVDDGSTDGTAEILDQLECDVPLRVIHQSNQGRLPARTTGLRQARGDYILFLDSRVQIEEGLDALVDRVAEGMVVWNAHVNISPDVGLLGTFWDAPTRIFWSDYLSSPRRISFGIEDFHRHPKGTTGFLAPRPVLLDAFDRFRSTYADSRHANDDTAVLQHVARRHRIWLSPEFSVRYEPRHSLRRFVPHAYHRGIVFVDGFLHQGNPFAPAILIFYGLSATLIPLSRRHHRLIPFAYLGVTVAAAGAGVFRKLSRRHITALALVTPVFVTAYGAGMWAGLALRLRDRMSA